MKRQSQVPGLGYRSGLAGLAVLASLLVSSTVVAQRDTRKEELATVEALEEVVVERDADTLADLVRRAPDEPDVVDTAMVFTNDAAGDREVRCVVWSKGGEPVARFRVKVPRKGLRYALLSDVLGDRDLVGSTRCRHRGRVTGSAFLIGVAFSDLPSSNRRFGISYPVTASY